MTAVPANPRISADPEIMVGKPCIKGTRVTVEIILRYLAGGAAHDRILEAFPVLCEDDILAAIEYAADAVSTPPVAAE